jgi:hypothetical protein
MGDANRFKGYVPCVGYEGYFVSVVGDVKNNEGQSLKPQNDIGYNKVFLYCDKVRYQERIHRLVCQAYWPNPLDLPYVNHKDGVTNHNYVMNTEWSSPSHNNQHAIDTGLRTPFSKEFTMTAPDGRRVTFKNMSKFCKDNGLSRSCMNYVLSGKNKQHNGWKL